VKKPEVEFKKKVLTELRKEQVTESTLRSIAEEVYNYFGKEILYRDAKCSKTQEQKLFSILDSWKTLESSLGRGSNFYVILHEYKIGSLLPDEPMDVMSFKMKSSTKLNVVVIGLISLPEIIVLSGDEEVYLHELDPLLRGFVYSGYPAYVGNGGSFYAEFGASYTIRLKGKGPFILGIFEVVYY